MLDNKIFNRLKPGYSKSQITKPDITGIQGVPGCGKSTWIINHHSLGRDLVLCSTREGINDLKMKIKTRCANQNIDFNKIETNYRTIASYLLNGVKNYTTVYIDECSLIHAGFIGLVAMVSQCSKIFLLGDKNQIPYIDRLHYVNMRFFDAFKLFVEPKQLNTTYRCPADVVYTLSDIYPNFCTTNIIKTSLEYHKLPSDISLLPILENTYYLTFTKAEKTTLQSQLILPSSCKIITIHEAQGLSSPNIVCVRLLSQPIKLFESLPHIIVSMTRHTRKFRYYAPVDEDLLISLIKKSHNASESDLALVTKEPLEPISNIAPPDEISSKRRNYTFYFQNVNKMASKAQKFSNYVLKTNFAIYVINETSFNHTIQSSEFFPNEYVVHRCDRSSTTSSKKSGGGVLIAVHSAISNERLELPPSPVEEVCVKVTIHKKKFYIYTAYIPPQSSIELYMKCIESIGEICNIADSTDQVLIPADFNLPNINWTYDSEMNCNLPTNITSDTEGLFLDAMLNFNLHQINDIKNERERILDLVFTNELNIFKITESLTPFVSNDINHKSLEISFDSAEIDGNCNNHLNNNLEFNFKKANTNNLKEYFQTIQWNEELSDENININVKKFYELIHRGFELHVPMTKKTSNNHPPWFDDTLINLKNRKNKDYAKMKKTNLASDRQIFIESNKHFETYYNQQYKTYILEIQDKIKDKPKQFWNFFNTKREIKGYPSNMTFNGSNSSDSQEIANMFGEFFQSVYKSEDVDNYTDSGNINSNISITPPVITPDDILSALKSFKDGCGPDKIPSFILKTYANELINPLCQLFNKSLVSGVFPTSWKISKITPIFKSGKRSDISCYRGISTTSSIPKLFELVICNSFKNVVSSHLSVNQHGFMPGRSTATNLVEFTSRVLKAIEQHHQVDTVYTDFSKAFDSISHCKGLESLSEFGFSAQFVKWFSSYLEQRVQFVEIGGSKSNAIRASSGVPQGSHVGPWIFLIFINRIVKVIIYCYILIFADDLKIFRIIREPDDCRKLQEDINNLNEWCKTNQLQLNISKCKIVSFYKKKNPIIHDYHINCKHLQRVTEIKDLGITFMENMNFNKHIDLCIAKANSMFGFIKRWTFEITDQKTLFILYFAYIRSQLEYAVTIWCPFYEVHTKRIESVQKKFLIHILKKSGWDYDHDLPYHENLARLPSYTTRCLDYKILTLENRRKLLGASFLGNILLGHTDSAFILENIQLQVPTRNLRQHHFLHLDLHRTNYGENEPINMMSKIFNSIEDLFDFNISRDSFRNKLKDHFLRI